MRFILLLIAVVLFESCKNKDFERTDVEQVSAVDQVKDSESQGERKAEVKVGVFFDIQEFWVEFRRATLNQDFNQVAAMTVFPFRTRGPLDDDPVNEYGKSRFYKVFQSFLSQWNGSDLSGSTELDAIRATAAVDKKYVNGNYARVGDLVFEKDAVTGWRLTFAYLNGETLDSLSK
jgi:hypothetical protein